MLRGRCAHDDGQAGKSEKGSNCLAHTAQWANLNPTAEQWQHETETRQLCSHALCLTTALERIKELECQEGLYHVDQRDRVGSDARLKIGNRRFAVSRAGIASARAGVDSDFFTRRAQEGTESRSVGRLDDCGAVRSRSHRLLLALLWQLAGPRGRLLLCDHGRPHAQAGDATEDEWCRSAVATAIERSLVLRLCRSGEAWSLDIPFPTRATAPPAARPLTLTFIPNPCP